MKTVAKKMKPFNIPEPVYRREEFTRETIFGNAFGIRYHMPTGKTLVLLEPTTETISDLENYGFDLRSDDKSKQEEVASSITSQLPLFLSIILKWEDDPNVYRPCSPAEFSFIPVLLEQGLLVGIVNDFFSFMTARANGTGTPAGTGATEKRGRIR